jgi:hypothetical protein
MAMAEYDVATKHSTESRNAVHVRAIRVMWSGAARRRAVGIVQMDRSRRSRKKNAKAASIGVTINDRKHVLRTPCATGPK